MGRNFISPPAVEILGMKEISSREVKSSAA